MTKSAALTRNLTLEKRICHFLLTTWDSWVKGFFHAKLKNVVTI